MAPVGEIERIDAPSAEEFRRRYVDGCKPVIITGVASQWPAVERWRDLSYLRRAIGKRTCLVKCVPRGVLPGVAVQKYRELLVGEFIDWLEDPSRFDESYYMAGVRPELYPELLEDIGKIPYLADTNGSAEAPFRAIFFGLDAYTHPHFHFGNQAIVTQIVGAKRMKLWSPDQYRLLYPYPVGHPANASRVNDIDAPDFERFPRFRESAPLEGTIHAGEMIYIPTFWWHAVYTRGLSFAITTMYDKDSRMYLRHPLPALHSVLAAGLTRVLDRFRGFTTDRPGRVEA
jgi:hypothetical protein